MIVRVISLRVKPEDIDNFKKASIANHIGSMNEPGVLRFDVLQSDTIPAEFMLYEVYESEEATQSHKETAHYLRWKEAIEPMMAEPRKRASFDVIAPEPENY